MWVLLSLLVWTSFTVAGQLVLVEEPTCTTALSVYACSRDVGSFDWDLVRDGGLLARVSFGSSFTPTGTIRNRQIESSMVTFNVTSASKNFLSVTTTINDTVSLNGVQMVCAGDTIIVEVRQRVPSILQVSKIGENVIIESQPSTNGILYFIISSFVIENGVTFGPLLLQAQNNSLNLTYICLGRTATFSIDLCIFQDEIENRTYISGTNGNWNIVQSCTEGVTINAENVTCNTNGTWSRNIIVCPDNFVPPTIPNATELSEMCEASSTMIKPDLSPSMSSNKSVGVFIVSIVISNLVSIIVSFAVGAVTGLVCIRKCLQRHQSRKGGKKDDVVHSHSVISKGPFYEDIDLENKASNIETNQNVAYGTATKHLH